MRKQEAIKDVWLATVLCAVIFKTPGNPARCLGERRVMDIVPKPRRRLILADYGFHHDLRC